MSLNELRDQLRADAESVTPPDAVRRVHAVRRLNRRRRRRTAAAVIAVAVVVVAAIVAVPAVDKLVVDPEPVDKPSGPFPEKVDGDTRIASVMGDEGESQVTLEFTPEDTDFLLDVKCDDLAPEGITGPASDDEWYARYSINGKRGKSLCGSSGTGADIGDVGGVASRDRVRKHWKRFGVAPGEPVQVRIQVVDGYQDMRRVRSPIRGRLGVAAYDMTGERHNVLGVALPEEKTMGDQTYELGDDGYTVAPAPQGRSSRLYVPESDESTLVTYGTIGQSLTPSRGSVDGVRGELPRKDGVASTLLAGGDAHTVKVKNLADIWVKQVVAYYKPVETAPDDETDSSEVSFPGVSDSRDPLVGSRIGEPGESVLRATFRPDDTSVELAIACDLGSEGISGVRTTVKVNGVEVDHGRCRQEASVKLQDDADGLGIVAGKPFDVVVRLDVGDYSSASRSDVTLGAALYERSAARVNTNDFVLPREQRHDGTWYKLARYESTDVAPGERHADLRRPTSDSSILVGSGFVESSKGWAQTWVDGHRIGYSLQGDGELTFRKVPGQSQHLVTKAIGRFHDGRLVIAYYTPEDP